MIPSPPFSTIPLGPLTVHFYGLIIGLAITTTYYLAHRWCKHFQLTPKIVDTLYLTVIPSAIVGARLYHCLSNWDFYSKYPIQIFAISNGGIGILGGILASIVVIGIFSHIKKIPFLTLTDFLVPLLVLGQAIGRWGNYFNQELYGLPTNLPWSLYIDPSYRLPNYETTSTFHPLFLYESLANLIIFFILVQKSNHTLLEFRISPTSIYLILYGLTRFLLEFLKIDPDTTNQLFGLKIAQYISLIMITTGILLNFLTYKKRKV